MSNALKITADLTHLNLNSVPRPETWIMAEANALARSPFSPGNYCLWQRDEIVYVGETKNIHRRLQDHLRDVDKPFDRASWLVVHGPERRVIEKLILCAYAPRWNNELDHSERREVLKRNYPKEG